MLKSKIRWIFQSSRGKGEFSFSANALKNSYLIPLNIFLSGMKIHFPFKNCFQEFSCVCASPRFEHHATRAISFCSVNRAPKLRNVHVRNFYFSFNEITFQYVRRSSTLKGGWKIINPADIRNRKKINKSANIKLFKLLSFFFMFDQEQKNLLPGRWRKEY